MRGRKTVVVLGMHRTGTSMIAGLLARLGVYMGEDKPGKLWSNPFGHFEDCAFLELNEYILGVSGGSWDNPPTNDRIIGQGSQLKERIQDLIKSRGNEYRIWGWKDPRSSLTIELFYPYLINPFFLVCHRDSDAVARSLRRRNGITMVEGKKLYALYARRLADFFSGKSDLDKMDLRYENVIEEPKKTIMEIIEFLGLDPSPNQIKKAINSIMPKEEKQKISKKMLISTCIRKPWNVALFFKRRLNL